MLYRLALPVKKIIHGIGMLLSVSVLGQTNWYIDQQQGSDSNSGLNPSEAFQSFEFAAPFLEPGDTLFLIGEFTNESYNPNYTFNGDINDPHIWHQEQTVRLFNIHGTPSNFITITSYDENTILKGDGANIIRMLNCSYLRIEGLHIKGEVDQIPLSTALALQFLYREEGSLQTLYRVPPGTPIEEIENMTFPILENITRPSYTDTRGLYATNVHHIEFVKNYIHHIPGNGFRVAECDYVWVSENTIHDTSRKSYSGTHGLVITKATSLDEEDGYKIYIDRNLVHHNYNEIFSWAPDKTIITPRIDEGKGISLQRNDVSRGWLHGRFLVSNNLCFWNGFSGVHSNTGERMDFINNTCYMNSYTNTITYANGEQMGKNIGISSQGGNDIKLINNVVHIDNAWQGFPLSSANDSNLEVRNNLVFGINGDLSLDPDVTAIDQNTWEGNPLFIDPNSGNFRLQEGSPAIGLAETSYAPSNDFYGAPRDAQPDLGAIEFNPNLNIPHTAANNKPSVYPNPFTDRIIIVAPHTIERIQLFSIEGKALEITPSIGVGTNTFCELNLSPLSNGTYLLLVDNAMVKLIKR